MMPFTFNSLICWQITLTLLNVSWIGLLIGVVAAASNRVMRNSAASRRYAVNFLSLLVLAASLPVTFAIVRSGAEANPRTVPMALNSIEEEALLIPHTIGIRADSRVGSFASPRSFDDRLAASPGSHLVLPSRDVVSQPSHPRRTRNQLRRSGARCRRRSPAIRAIAAASRRTPSCR